MTDVHVVHLQTAVDHIEVTIDGARFTCASATLRRVPEDQSAYERDPLAVELVDEYELVLRVRPNDSKVKFTIDSRPVYLTAYDQPLP